MEKHRNNMKKRGQVTIFIIIAVIIVALAVLIYFLFPQIQLALGYGEENPSVYLQNCIEDEVEKTVDELSLQGGSINPEHYILYGGEKIEYLCYTGEYYKTCVMQQPMLQQHIEDEIADNIKSVSSACFNSMEESFKKRGYSVNLQKGDMSVELLPKRIVVTFDSSLSLTKTNTARYDSFRVVVNNNLYELVSITNSILNWEARYGDAETTIYMNYYHDLQVEKKIQSDGSTVYILTDRNNENKFQFASRSLAWPPGYE